MMFVYFRIGFGWVLFGWLLSSLAACSSFSTREEDKPTVEGVDGLPSEPGDGSAFGFHSNPADVDADGGSSTSGDAGLDAKAACARIRPEFASTITCYEGQCVASPLNCLAGRPCVIRCMGERSCMSSILNCPTQQPCVVECEHPTSCQNFQARGAPSKLDVSCFNGACASSSSTPLCTKDGGVTYVPCDLTCKE